MRYGFTTGSCAAAAAKAAAYMLLTGREKTEITIETPKGLPYTAQIRNICRKEQEVSCAVEKDGGDDPDITTGALICAKVSFAEITDRKAREEPGRKNGTGHAPEQAQVVIDGGIGVGRVTKPGLDQPVGNAAINHVPRKMIEREVLQVCQVLDYRGILSVEISVPEGEKLAEKTFNPRLGIVDGLSVLGTTGIVRPMSEEAMKDSLIAELDMYAKQGHKTILFVLGGTGETALKEQYGEFQCILQVSNYIGFMIEEAVERGFTDILIGGFVGKLVKVASGTMNTHSHVADGRIETICTHAALHGAPTSVIKKIYDCLTTKAAMKIVEEEGLMDIWPDMAQKASEYCEKTAHKMARVGIIFLDGQNEILAASENIKEVLSACKK
mgnify:CR=1 FL=1